MKKTLFALLLLTQFCYAETPILTPAFKDRQTARVTLPNGLQAYIVSDPNLEESGALLTVGAGSWDEPKDALGIAHFLEHMLFLGTKKYPSEGEYQRYISMHNGHANAFTASTYTAYLFTIENKAFPEALDRFSEFFKEPLFNPSGVDRELQAIDQEYAKNLESDDFRQYFVLKELSSEDHPERRFNIGTKETLAKVSQATLKKWYQEHYSANLMRLVVYSTLPLPELKAMVDQEFSPIEDKKIAPSSFSMFSTPNDLYGKMIYIEPVKNMRALTLMWELPQKFALMKDTQPEQIISYILGHEGEESLLAKLKQEKLADGIKSGAYKRGSSTMLFQIEISLTDAGIEQINDVIAQTFETLNFLKEQKIPESLFNEIKQLATIDYQYQQRSALFEALTREGQTIPNYDMERYPEQAYIVERFDGAATEEILDLLTPDKALYFLTAPSSLTGVKAEKKEEWLHAPYTVKPIPEKTLAAWNALDAGPKDSLPTSNPFIPANLAIINPMKSREQLPLVPQPTKLVDDASGILYFAPDEQYGTPKISWSIELKTPLIDAGKPMRVVLGDLVIKSVKEALSKYSYNADMAGLKYEISQSDFGILILIEGYSEHAPTLYKEILQALKTAAPTEEQFTLYKDSLTRDYQNALKEMPVRQALDILKSALYKSYTLPKQKITAMRRVSFEKFTHYARELFHQAYVEAILYGNMTKENALAVWKETKQTFQSEPYTDRLKQEVIVLPPTGGPYYVECTSKSQGNAVILAVEGNGYSFKKRAAQQILSQTLAQNFFAELRTKQQTGYIVQSWAEEIELELFTLFAVQSNTHNVHDLLARYELFNQSFLQELNHDLDEETFLKIKYALLVQLETPQKSLSDMSKLLQTLAFKYKGDFTWLDKRIEAFKSLTYSEFIALSRELLGKSNYRRMAILLKGATPDETPSYQKMTNIDQLKKVSEYKASS